ncbi:MAG TPA: T9SS type A sorting domain-containing protein [Bacteroidales bacterium]|nr:T9SS type A sorting domain-containing protein [Bacteroidales bacterium]HPS17123.1 T9SS type A sorting domain-containing protein [Bacteroidales bacterium]
MKKFLLFTLAIGIAVSVSAQVKKHVAHYNGPTAKYSPVMKLDLSTNQTPITKSFQKKNNAAKTTNSITDVTMGTSGNAFGFYGGGRTYLWADDNIGSVAFSHRASTNPGSGYIQYDLSTDKGTTWSVNQGPAYSPDNVTHFGARYPQGLIYNPLNNTDPKNAYFSYMAPTLDNTNSNWGGMCYGVKKLDGTTAATQTSLMSSENNIWHVIPNAYHVTQQGTIWAIEPSDSLDATGYGHYKGMIVTKGVWNSTTNDFDITRTILNIPFSGDATDATIVYCADNRIAFAPDGQVGYMAFIGHDDFTWMPDSCYYPILYKTVDGGANWTGPIRVDLSNLPELKQALSPDSNYLLSPGFQLDLAVDRDGNPYMGMAVCVAGDAWSVPTAPGYICQAAVYSTDGGTNWDARFLDYNQRFRGTFAAGTANQITEDSRPQVATDMEGTAMFFTWLDTDTVNYTGTTDNYYPDIHMRGFKVTDHEVFPALTESSNVTTGTLADGCAYMGSASYYAFDNGNNEFEVPLCYMKMDPTNTITEVTFHYLKGAIVNVSGAGINDINNNIASVSQNYPNPFSNTSVVTVNLSERANLTMSICNLVGQKVYETTKGTVNAGTYNFNIDGSNLSSGVYYYTIKAGDYSVTHKMIVE